MIKIIKDPAMEGVQFTFSNGVTLSIMCGAYHYVDREQVKDVRGTHISKNAEIAVFDKEGWRTREALIACGYETDPADDVYGQCPTDQIAGLMFWCATAKRRA